MDTDIDVAIIYCGIAFAASAIAFIVLRIRDGLTHLFSVHDALEVAKSILLAEAITFLVLFSLTRLEGIPRSTPIIHALILGAALVSGRAFVRMFYSETNLAEDRGATEAQYAIVIGSNKLSALYIELLRTYAANQAVVGVLDDRPETLGRSTAGARVLGPTCHLEQLVQEYLDHGIRIEQILIGYDPEDIGDELRTCVQTVAAKHNLNVSFIPELVGLRSLTRKSNLATGKSTAADHIFAEARPYFAVKRYIDFALAMTLLVLLSPFFFLTVFLVLVDMGSPVFFWQRRIGMYERKFQLHKFRTLKPSFDGNAFAIPSGSRLSPIGRILRNCRLDELPQLLNVLVGDMSIVGPRPLLPKDQPTNPSVRLSIRPGITGWAQVNGGKLLDAETKNLYDEWYVHNASFALDLKIIGLTALMMIRGESLNGMSAAPKVALANSSSETPEVPHDLKVPAE